MHRKRIKALDTVESETEDKLKKATAKITAHNALTAHRKAPSVDGAAAAMRLAGKLKKGKGLKKKGDAQREAGEETPLPPLGGAAAALAALAQGGTNSTGPTAPTDE